MSEAAQVAIQSKAAQVAIDKAKKTIHGITALAIIDITYKVNSNTEKIT